MKSHSSQNQEGHLVLASLMAAFCALIALAGCTTMQPASQESLLQQAGFQSRTPTTAKQKAVYAKLPANQLQRVTVNGRTIYGYKDEKAGVVWVGDEAQYAQYKQLAVKAKLKEEQFTPAQTALEAKDVHTYNQWYLGRIP
jgi:uncharacterized protein YfaQ (DUF2300 family)